MTAQIDFSNFTPGILESIEETGRFCRQIKSSEMDAATLIAGLCKIDGLAVKNFFEGNGYDFNASMQNLANVFNSRERHSRNRGIHFSPEVENAFRLCAGSPATVDIRDVLEALLQTAHTELLCHLVRQPQPEVPVNQPVSSQSNGEEASSRTLRNPADDDNDTADIILQYCVNMLQLAADGRIFHAIGREKELERILLILARSSKNNPVLVGEPGTGKTAIAEELAIRLYEGNVPQSLSGLKLYSLDFSSVKASPDRVNIMKSILEKASADPRLVLFIDEIHMLISASSCSDNDIANLLKPAMARGEIKLMGATTLDEYKKIESDPAFERRFQKVIVDEPDIESACLIVSGAKHKYESHHEVEIPDDVCKTAVRLSARYITNRKLPDKAFDLLDEASAELRIKDANRRTLVDNDIMKVITAWTGIPVDDLNPEDATRLQNIEEELRSFVIGQDHAVKAVADAIKRSRLGFGDASRPIGSFLFLGTTGTGKTELSKALANFLFNDPKRMVRIDMSEYQQEFSVQRLFGAPPGYVGYDQGGQLTEAVYRKPFSVVLFDEIEKAHPKIFETLLQVLDDGRMTDGQGKVVDFKNTIIIMTSNMGQELILSALNGRAASDPEIEACTDNVMQLLRQKVAPEFINRIDSIVMFLPLGKDEIVKIAELNLRKECGKLREKGMQLHLSPDVMTFISEKGYKPEYGGRPVKRAIRDLITNPLTSAIVDGTIDKRFPIIITVENDNISISNGHAGRVQS
ncbi:MAG: ATP-dependent Clp protease ATP-binding subunit [Muribaculaceae bacterium]|nr:ATP-dependent Clp protease ATP-binding subunit [Muribaculaceae bacterium]